MLTPRRFQIFKAIVDLFIKTAEPVGSKALQEKYKLPYSSATIRNDMKVLEEMGYLEKTYTSSGRVPSTLGYKFYCETMLDESNLDKRMELAIRNAFEATSLSVDEAIRQSCEILSEMTNMTAGVIGPDASKQRLAHIKLFPLDDKGAVCVFITDQGHTETRTFHFNETVSTYDLETTTDILNKRLKGVTLTNLANELETIRPELGQVVKRHEILFTAFLKAFIRFANDSVYFSGKDKVLFQPEFEDINKMKQLVGMFEDKKVWQHMDDNTNAVALTMRSGSQLTWVNDLAVVRSKFHLNDDDSGELMVVGPSRMAYDRIVPLLDYVARMIEKAYSKGDDHDEESKENDR